MMTAEHAKEPQSFGDAREKQVLRFAQDDKI
jgi:hypothetical protein